MKHTINKSVISFIIVSLALISFYGLIDHYGKKYTDESFERALIAFGIAKGLNAAISVAQGTEIALEPAGVGLIFAPGQILDPVNDLIERFSWVMLACTTSLGIQGILLKIFSSGAFSLIVSSALILLIIFIWRKDLVSKQVLQVMYRSVVFLIILRFFIPFMAISSEGLYRAFLESDFIESTDSLQNAKTDVEQFNDQNREISETSQDKSWYEEITENLSNAMNSLNIKKRYAELQLAVEDVTIDLINLIVVFTLQTILFPLLFIWLAIKLSKAAFTVRFN
jgi:hypothetical protein